MRPQSARTRSTMRVRSACFVTSVGSASALPPTPRTSLAVRSAPSAFSSATTTSAPSRASSSAVARPMPRPPPVTMATLPASSLPWSLTVREYTTWYLTPPWTAAPTRDRRVVTRASTSRRSPTAGTPAQRATLERDLRLAEGYLAEVRALTPALPTIAFERTMTLYRRDREIQLLHLGRAHTEGDVFVYLPKEKVVITGDAVIGWTPYMGDGYPDEWAATLDRLAQLDFTHIIMGHGNVAGREWFGTFRSYAHEMVEAVRQEAATGVTLEEVKQRVTAKLAPRHEKAFAAYADYRPWRTGVLANIERTFAMVS